MLARLLRGPGTGIHELAPTTLEDASVLFPVVGDLLLRASSAQDAGDVEALRDSLAALRDAVSLFLIRH